jgi:hypothetical protein
MIEENTYLIVQTVEDTDRLMAKVWEAAESAQKWIGTQTGDPLDMIRRIKFESVGFHPIDHRSLNLIEQINQTWTFVG